MITSRKTKDGKPVMDIEYTTSVATPHVPWAKPYVNGPLKAFFLPSVKGGRDFAEFMQRLDVDAVSVTHDRAWDLDKWGFGDFYGKRVEIWKHETIYAYMLDALTSDDWYDVLVLPSVNGWGLWPEAVRKAILRRVKAGAGLVLVHPFEGAEKAPELAALSPLVGCPNDTVDDGGYPVIPARVLKSAAWQRQGSHFITANIPLDAIFYDEIAYYPYKAAKGSSVILSAGRGDPIAAVRKVGKGRVVAFGWYNRDLVPQHKKHAKPSGGLSSNSDFWVGGSSECTWKYVEYIYAMLARAAVWAARKEPAVALALSAEGPASPSLAVSLSGGSGSLIVDAEIVNEWGRREAKISRAIRAAAKRPLVIDLSGEALSGGAHFANVIIKRKGKSVTWGAVRFDTPKRAEVRSIKTDKDVYKPGENVTAAINVGRHGDKVQLEAAIVDAFDRVVSRKAAAVASGGKVQVALSRKGVLTPQMWVRVRLTEGGRLIDEKKSSRLLAVPDWDRNLDDVELVVAQMDRGRGDYVEVVRRQLLDFGATGGYYGYSKLLVQTGAKGGGIYWYHRAPYIERKEKYIRTGNKKYLVRVPCLNNPKFKKNIHDTVVKTAAKGTKYAPLSYYVQDEGSLTCYRDQMDLCFSPHTLKAMREWLESEYGNLKALNDEWGTRLRSWNRVVPMTLSEAREHGNLAPWADHRTFMEIAFADFFRLIRDSVREVDPDGRIRISGCQVSSAYTGMDYWRLHQVIEYFEAYGGGNQFEFHHSFARPRTVLGTWIGYGQKGRTSNHKIWDAFFHDIRLFSVFWEYAVLNADFTLSGSAEDMRDTFRELRGSGVSRMLFSAERDNTGIAIHYSYPSIHAAEGLVKLQRLEGARQGWLNILQDLGYQQTFLSRQQIEAGDLISRGFKVFIMPMSMAVGPREAREIRRFVKAGGHVIADFQTAIMDDHCKRQEKGFLDDVFGIRRYDMRNEPFFINREPMRTEHLPEIDAGAVQDANVILEEPGVRADAGRPLFVDDFTHYVPGIVVNQYGKGAAAYLNFSVNVAASDPDSPQAGALKEAVGDVLGHFGARPVMRVTGGDGRPLAHVEMFGYRGGGVRYFALLRENVGAGTSIAYDGIVHGGEDTAAVAEKISVSLPVTGHLYDCLEKKYLGRGDSIETTIEPAQAKVFAVYPYSIKDLDVSAKPAG
ncbi:MAG: beta-galactosidase, partial [Planctomycetes bacterium]|nr:beta-galactosidase [Planctomycetota bacterium]